MMWNFFRDPGADGWALVLFGVGALGLAGFLSWLFRPALSGWSPLDLVRDRPTPQTMELRCARCGIIDRRGYYSHQVCEVPEEKRVMLCAECYEVIATEEERGEGAEHA